MFEMDKLGKQIAMLVAAKEFEIALRELNQAKIQLAIAIARKGAYETN